MCRWLDEDGWQKNLSGEIAECKNQHVVDDSVHHELPEPCAEFSIRMASAFWGSKLQS